jgi:hypothetical protein
MSSVPSLTTRGADRRVFGDRLGVEDDSARHEGRVDAAQSVHDALERHASQRPAAQRQVKPPARHVERLRIMHGEADSVAKVARDGLLGLGHRARVGIERIHLRGVRRSEGRQPPGSSSDVHDNLAVQIGDCSDGRCLSSLTIAPVHRGHSYTSTMPAPSLPQAGQ